ncbi:MAG TPA: YqhR family membrane protein [Bacillus sp. (in: firmicutes)]|uniref:YqhR family membrane protein n=1 Tax=Bacillus litorisediminis TaxID=2922713 RepID=UPI001FABA98F|nr:YqhR family membrane protein [Bacillus litorisediminis]HWO77605.1 YqhR family membrane protein [Bacillus sp. (in: firmicutes)]
MSEENKEKSKENKELEQNKTEEQLSLAALSAIIGLCGGLFWSLIGYVAYLFSFTKVSPRAVLEPIAVGDWKNTWLGLVISIVLLSVLSMGAALLYYAAFRRFKGMWLGMAYGLLLFGVIFFILNPLFPSIRPIREIDGYTWVTSACLYILYGVFIGYSISYEANDLRVKEKQEVSQ